MCGIFGEVRLNSKIDYPEPSLKYLKDRGPDGEGFYKSNNVILGHARLAVIDEEQTSSQPIVNGNLAVVCNGEILNYKEIEKSGGFDYVGTSDCESIMHVYKQFGTEGFLKLDGFFAFGLYDAEREKLIIHKDGIGKKPLYFLNDNGRFIFASTTLAVAQNYRSSLKINKKQIGHYLQNGFVYPKETIFEKIFPVLPGEVIEVDCKTGLMKREFLRSHCRFDGPKSFDEIQTNAENLLKRAIEKRISGLKHPVLLFSGGIDSTVLASYMLKINPRTKLVSVKQPIRFLNDERWARQAAKVLNAPVYFVKIFRKSFCFEVDDFMEKLDQPLANYAYYFLSSMALKAKAHGKVLFTGDGGDEVFFGYDDISRWFDSGAKEASIPEILVGPPPQMSLTGFGLRTISLGLLGVDFIKTDKATAENQMEGRCPFLDRDLMCYMRSLPTDMCLQFTETKGILKNILRKNGFSKSFVERKKIGFSFPFRYLMMFRYGHMKNILESRRDEMKGLIDYATPSFFSLFQEFDYYWKIFVLINFMDNCRKGGIDFKL